MRDIKKYVQDNYEFVKDEINDTIEDIASFYNFTYKFSNIGSTPIKIVDIKTSCTCTIPSIKKILLCRMKVEK